MFVHENGKQQIKWPNNVARGEKPFVGVSVCIFLTFSLFLLFLDHCKMLRISEEDLQGLHTKDVNANDLCVQLKLMKNPVPYTEGPRQGLIGDRSMDVRDTRFESTALKFLDKAEKQKICSPILWPHQKLAYPGCSPNGQSDDPPTAKRRKGVKMREKTHKCDWEGCECAFAQSSNIPLSGSACPIYSPHFMCLFGFVFWFLNPSFCLHLDA